MFYKPYIERDETQSRPAHAPTSSSSDVADAPPAAAPIRAGPHHHGVHSQPHNNVLSRILQHNDSFGDLDDESEDDDTAATSPPVAAVEQMQYHNFARMRAPAHHPPPHHPHPSPHLCNAHAVVAAHYLVELTEYEIEDTMPGPRPLPPPLPTGHTASSSPAPRPSPGSCSGPSAFSGPPLPGPPTRHSPARQRSQLCRTASAHDPERPPPGSCPEEHRAEPLPGSMLGTRHSMTPRGSFSGVGAGGSQGAAVPPPHVEAPRGRISGSLFRFGRQLLGPS